MIKFPDEETLPDAHSIHTDDDLTDEETLPDAVPDAVASSSPPRHSKGKKARTTGGGIAVDKGSKAVYKGSKVKQPPPKTAAVIAVPPPGPTSAAAQAACVGSAVAAESLQPLLGNVPVISQVSSGRQDPWQNPAAPREVTAADPWHPGDTNHAAAVVAAPPMPSLGTSAAA